MVQLATQLLSLLLPLFLLAALGCALVRKRLLAPGWQTGLTELVAKIFIPALLFSGAFKYGIPPSVSWQVLAAFFLPLLILFAVAASLCQDGKGAPRALAATYSNTVFGGLPVLTQVFGPDSLQYAFPVIAFHGLVAFTLYFLAAPQLSASARLGASLGNVAKSPIVARRCRSGSGSSVPWNDETSYDRCHAYLTSFCSETKQFPNNDWDSLA